MLHSLKPGTNAPRVLARAVLVALLALNAMLLLACGTPQPQGGVQVLTVDGMINPVMANYLERGIEEAERSSARAVVIRLNTPGGLDSSMREIVQAIMASEVPVIVYVAPTGARAASAGTFVTMAAHIAAMAPATAIGAAHPVMAGGDDIPGDDLRTKAENDAAAYIRSIAESRGRNADWAESAVRVSASVSASEAVALNVVDLQASSLDELLLAIDGREVTIAPGTTVVLEMDSVLRHENPMTFSERFLMRISDPNIAFLLLSLGSLALVLELYNPSGIGLVVGGVALTIAFFSLGTLPVNWAGVALVALAISLFVAELFIVSGGLLALVGAVTLALGGLFLTTSNQPAFEVSRWLALGVPAVMGAAVAIMALFLLRLRKRVPTVGPEALVGSAGLALSSLGPGQTGYVLMQGERWRADLDLASHLPLSPGDAAIVTGVRGLLLTVRHAKHAEPPVDDVQSETEEAEPAQPT
jgi:membrane-bound serine protease (ClpP class)